MKDTKTALADMCNKVNNELKEACRKRNSRCLTAKTWNQKRLEEVRAGELNNLEGLTVETPPKEKRVFLYASLQAKLRPSTVGEVHSICEALNITGKLHCTLMYSGFHGQKTPFLQTDSYSEFITRVADVRYIEHADVTCLILGRIPSVQALHDKYRNLGFELSYEFEPHLTVAKGNHVDAYLALRGTVVTLSSERIQIIVK